MDDESKTTIKELVEVSIDKDNPKKKVLIGALLKREEREDLKIFLQNNRDIFSWSHKDIPGIDSS